MQSINANLESSQSAISLSPNPNSSVAALLYPHHSSNENFHLYQHNHTVSNAQSNQSHFHSTNNINNINNINNNNINNNNLANRSHLIFPNSSSPSSIQQLSASVQHSNSNYKN
jgi:hypothetical protein